MRLFFKYVGGKLIFMTPESSRERSDAARQSASQCRATIARANREATATVPTPNTRSIAAHVLCPEQE